MILQALTDYYDRRCAGSDPAQRLPPFGLEDKEIPFVIELAIDGVVVQLKDTRTTDGKKMRAKVYLVPLGREENLRHQSQPAMGHRRLRDRPRA